MFLAIVQFGSNPPPPLPSAGIGRLYLLHRENKDEEGGRKGAVIAVGEWGGGMG